jgi:hypothetical protein
MILAQLTALRKMIYSFIVATLAYSWRSSILSITQVIMISYLIQSTTTMLLSLCLLARPSPATW